MGVLETRLRSLEQATTDKSPLLVFVPSGTATLEQLREIDDARQAGRAVILVNATDADL